MADEKKADKKSSTANKLLANEKYKKIVVIAGFAGIALIFISSLFPSSKKSTADTAAAKSKQEMTAQQYEARLENNLTGIISQIQGAGNTKVMITLEQTEEHVYATENKKSGQTAKDKSDDGVTKDETQESNEKSYLLIKNDDGSESALSVTQIQPLVKGVVVVCDGGGDPEVKQNIIDAVTTALHITSVRVCVLKAK